jgi:hypothetical protein
VPDGEDDRSTLRKKEKEETVNYRGPERIAQGEETCLVRVYYGK